MLPDKLPLHSPRDINSLREWIENEALRAPIRIVVCGGDGSGKTSLGALIGHEAEHTAPRNKRTRTKGRQGSDLDAEQRAVQKKHGIGSPTCRYVVADASAHEPSLRNLLTDIAQADAAVLVLDATTGLCRESKRHALLLSLLGPRNIVLAINKLDLVSNGQRICDAITADFEHLALPRKLNRVTSIPLSALRGDNIHTLSPHTPWHQGPTLTACLEQFGSTPSKDGKTTLPVQYVASSPEGAQHISGTLGGGSLELGDRIRITASGETASVVRLHTPRGDLASVSAGTPVSLELDHCLNVARGDVITLADQPCDMTDQFEASLIWLDEEAGLTGRAYEIKLATQRASASLTSIKYRFAPNTLAHEPCRRLERDDIAVVNIALTHALTFTPYSESTSLGAFVLLDKFTRNTVAAGTIHHSLRRSQNVHRQALSIARQDRERLNGHTGKVVWFTGLSGSGKSTLANALEQVLHDQGRHTYILDGDNIRQGLNKDLGFTDADRVENIRRVAEVARLMLDAGIIVITAFISPFRAERQMAKELVGSENFVEVFVDTPLEVCEQRDPKGLYKKARNGQIPNMTGINSPYERPDDANFVISHEDGEIEAAVARLIAFLDV